MASDELANAGVILRLRVRFHLLICLECRRYTVQLHMIGAAAREMIGGLISDTDSLARLERSILDDAFGGGNRQS